MARPNAALHGTARRARRLVVPLAAALLLASPQIAAAQYPSWLIRYLSGYNFLPNPPSAQQSTRLLLYGWFPYDCGQVSSATVIDPEHVELTLDPAAAGCDSTGRYWSHIFDLGLLAAGNHTINLTLTMNRPDSGQVVEHGSFDFGVEDTTVVTPPPPPYYPPGFMPNVLQWSLDPPRPNITQPTHIDLLGWFPYQCGEVANARVVDNSNVELTLRPGAACTDSVRMWDHRFDFGLLPAGLYDVTVHLTLQQPGAPDSVETGVISFEVFETAAPPPPPYEPPPDSLRDVMSRTRPNPFADETRFGVTLDTAVAGDVAIFDISGRRVTTLYRGQLPRGTSQFAWNGRRSDGKPAPGGIYFYRLAIPGRVVARRVVLLGQP